MTKKNYLKAANLIKVKDERDMLIETFIKFFEDDNSKFDTDRFRKACISPTR
jgi:hypothetical protein